MAIHGCCHSDLANWIRIQKQKQSCELKSMQWILRICTWSIMDNIRESKDPIVLASEKVGMHIRQIVWADIEWVNRACQKAKNVERILHAENEGWNLSFHNSISTRVEKCEQGEFVVSWTSWSKTPTLHTSGTNGLLLSRREGWSCGFLCQWRNPGPELYSQNKTL